MRGLFLEKFVENARHIEVQIFGDGKGEVIALGERDCSVQRRNQKVIEETPAPDLSRRRSAQALLDAAVRLGKAGQLSIRRHGGIHLRCDRRGEFYFLEVNTRLQVEHGVTEEVTGIDLVEWMVRQAAGELPSPGVLRHRAARAHPSRCAFMRRIPPGISSHRCGTLTEAIFLSGEARVDTWVERGIEISPFYDPMLAKIIVHAAGSRRRRLPACWPRWTRPRWTASKPIWIT